MYSHIWVKNTKRPNRSDYWVDTSNEVWQESVDGMNDISDENENSDIENAYLQKETENCHDECNIVQNITRKDVEVMAVVSCDQSKTVCKENDPNMRIIRESQIVEVLKTPNMVMTGDRIINRLVKTIIT